MTQQKITTFLWFDNQAEEAARFYTSLFDDSSILEVHRRGEGAPVPGGEQGEVFLVRFQLAGQTYLALNGGPQFPFTEAISLYVDCADQAEVDRLWTALTADGGQESQCGWLKDKFGLSWQIVPTVLGELMSDPDPERSGRVTKAMLGMRKLDVQGLRDAYDG